MPPFEARLQLGRSEGREGGCEKDGGWWWVVEAMTKGCGMVLVVLDRSNPKAFTLAINSASRCVFVMGRSSASAYSLKRRVEQIKVSVCLTAAGLLSKKGIEVALRQSLD
jgi:hypothetical protein